MIPPQSRPDLPTIRASRGSSVRIHLAFAERSLTLTVARRRVLVTIDRSRRIISWRARMAGILNLDVHGGDGGASYVARLRVG
jgi:hypothetical protein